MDSIPIPGCVVDTCALLLPRFIMLLLRRPTGINQEQVVARQETSTHVVTTHFGKASAEFCYSNPPAPPWEWSVSTALMPTGLREAWASVIGLTRRRLEGVTHVRWSSFPRDASRILTAPRR